MADKHSVVFTLEPDLYKAGSPVIITSGAVTGDAGKRLLLNIVFTNVGDKDISTAVIDVYCFGADGEAQKGVSQHKYLGLSVPKGGSFGEGVQVPLPDADAASVKISVTKVFFTDNDIWLNEDDTPFAPMADVTAIPAKEAEDGTFAISSGQLSDNTPEPDKTPSDTPEPEVADAETDVTAPDGSDDTAEAGEPEAETEKHEANADMPEATDADAPVENAQPQTDEDITPEQNKIISLLKNKRFIIAGGAACAVIILAVSLFLIFNKDEPPQVEQVVAETPAPTVRPSSTPEPTPSPTPEPTPEPEAPDMPKSIFTGLDIDEELVGRRPVAVVINNLTRARPQSGIAAADIHYEVLAEGDITRIVSIFHSGTSERIGPVRSARHYFLDFALDHDALFVHHGGSPQGYAAINALGIENLDGMRESCFWRDPIRSVQPGMLEHSSYTSMSGLMEKADAHEYRTELYDGYAPMWDFYDVFTIPEGADMTATVTIPFSTNYASSFVYNEDECIYYRYQRGEPHIDEETDEQLTVANIIIQLASIHLISGDTEGRREVALVTDGEGFLLTGGTYAPIRWKKDSHETPTEWTDERGDRLMLNKGKTWICVFQNSSSVSFDADAD